MWLKKKYTYLTKIQLLPKKKCGGQKQPLREKWNKKLLTQLFYKEKSKYFTNGRSKQQIERQEPKKAFIDTETRFLRYKG